jgi:hypothetical protein
MLAASAAPSGRAGADDRVQLVDEQDHLALRLGDLAQHGLQAVLELAAVLAARDQRADVERDQPPLLQALGHVARDDALREPFGDRGLADAGLADQHGVVLGAPRQHLDHAADLLVAPDDGIDLALARDVGEVAAELGERLVLRLGIGVGHARAAAHGRERLEDRLAVGAGVAQRAAGRVALLARDREQQVLGGDVLVLELLGLGECSLEHARRGARELRLRAARHLRQRREPALELGRQLLDRDTELLQHGHRAAFGLREQRAQQVRGQDLAVAARARLGLRLASGLPGS